MYYDICKDKEGKIITTESKNDLIRKDHNNENLKNTSIYYKINEISIVSSETDSLLNKSSKIELDRDFNNKSNFIKLFTNQILITTPFFFAILTYIISLEPCLKDYDTCLNELDKDKIKRLLTISVISVFCFSIKLFIILHYESYKIIKFAIFTSTIGYLTLTYDTGNSFKSHGAYNRLFLYFGIPFTYLSFYFLLIIYRLNRKYGKIILIFFVGSLFILIIYFKNKYNNSCDYWDRGMKDSQIDNTVSCKLEKPKICNEIIFDNIFDAVYLSSDDCTKRRNDDPEIVRQYSNLKNLTKLAYPRVERWDLTYICNYYYYRDSVMRGVFNLDDPQIDYWFKKNIEVYVDFTQGIAPKVNIELKKNENLIKTRDVEFQDNLKKKNVLVKNILFFFIDSMSRNHFKRKLPKVYKWIERFYISNTEEIEFEKKSNKYNIKNINKNTHESFQFLKYHGVGTWTNINLQPFFFGSAYDSSEGIYSLNYFKRRGYITGSTENTCSREFVGLYSGEMSLLTWDYYDHDFTSFFCDPNFYSKEKTYSMTDGPYCYRRKCLYGRQTYEYSIEYTNQFWDTYKDYGKMFRLGNIDAHEGTGESIKYLENDMMNFLNNFEKKGHLNDTMIIFFSDHGYTMPGIHQILQSEDHVKELLLPFVYILLPKNIENYEKIRENLKHNENMFMTPYDMHQTLLGMLNINDKSFNNLGTDIFNNKLKGDEGCKKFKIKDEWCKCRHDDQSLN